MTLAIFTINGNVYVFGKSLYQPQHLLSEVPPLKDKFSA
jgi:hypothetical protein